MAIFKYKKLVFLITVVFIKFFLVIVLLLTASLNLKAQQHLIKDKYYPVPELNKFVGKWMYADDTINITIELKNEKIYIKGSAIYMDMIQGDYILKRNGNVMRSSVGKDVAITSGGFVDKKLSLTKIKFIFTDLDKKSNRGSVIFELLNNNTAKWTLTNTEHIVVGNEHYDPTFSVPRHMIIYSTVRSIGIADDLF